MHTTLQWGSFQLDGIGLSTYTAIILNQLLRRWNFTKFKRPATVLKNSDSSPVAASVVVV